MTSFTPTAVLSLFVLTSALSSACGEANDPALNRVGGDASSGGSAAELGDAPTANSSGGAFSSGGQGVVGSGGSSAATGGADNTGSGGQVIDADGWQLVWSDEFDGSSIDSSKWQHEVNCWGGGNNEQQCYVTDAKNAFVKDGFLHLVARADSPSGAVGQGDSTIVTRPYSSARLNTAHATSFKYGKFEARMKLPHGQGIWPAFWMLPTDYVYGGWAASGEIDIMEAVNSSTSNNKVYGTIHYGAPWPANVYTTGEYTPSVYVAENFISYAVEWQEGEIRWYVDEQEYQALTEWYSTGSDYPAPFNQNFHLLLNLAVGGNWPGAPDASTTFPQELLVDYVRVYQCSKDPSTGKGC